VLIVSLVLSLVNFLCFGETGTGKTYTLFGDKEKGVIQLVMETVFGYIETRSGEDFLIRASLFEIFNENINDLLSNKIDLLLLETGNNSAQVKGLTEVICTDAMVGINLIKNIKLEKKKYSELVYKLIVESRIRNDNSITISTINLIKLSSSNFLSAEINDASIIFHKGLNQLNVVMHKLAKRQNEPIEYNESKLTKYLQRALEGKARTALICTMSPAATSYDKTINTFRFAMIAKSIRLNPEKNPVDNQSLITRYDFDSKEIVASDKLSDYFEKNLDDISTELEEKILNSFKIQERIKKLYEEKKKSNSLPSNTQASIEREDVWRVEVKDLINPLEVEELLDEKLKEILIDSEEKYFIEVQKEKAWYIKASSQYNNRK